MLNEILAQMAPSYIKSKVRIVQEEAEEIGRNSLIEL